MVTHHRANDRHLPCEIASHPTKVNAPALALARKAGTRFIYSRRNWPWVDLGGSLRYTEMNTVTHPSSNRARRRATSLMKTGDATTLLFICTLSHGKEWDKWMLNELIIQSRQCFDWHLFHAGWRPVVWSTLSFVWSRLNASVGYWHVMSLYLIPRLHDRANIKQMHSKYACTTWALIACCLLFLLYVRLRFAWWLIDVCLMV